MPDTTLSVGFNVPFDEAIAAMDAREIVLPAKYYGELQGIQRQLAFSIAGVASLDQLQGVLNAMTAKLQNGNSFQQWQDSVAVQDLGLPKHRLDNIYRTNIQNAYNRGHWEQFKQNEAYQPYLMYDAINDSRTRPSHRALDGIIRRIDDPFWDTHYPANGYRCRCSVVALSESQAQARSKGDNGLNKKIEPDNMKPDKGWDYNCGSDITAGINKAIADRLAKAAAKTIEPKLAKPLKKKVAVPKDDPLHVDKIVAKSVDDAPPVAPKSKSVKKPAKPKNAPYEQPPFKLASETPQINEAAKKFTKEHIDSLQKSMPYKFEEGVFNPNIVKTGGKIKKLAEADGLPLNSSPKVSKLPTQKDPIAATWDDESLALMKEQFPQNFDKNGQWVNPSKIKPTPSNEKVKETLGKKEPVSKTLPKDNETERKDRRKSADVKIAKGKFLSEKDQNAIISQVRKSFNIEHYWEEDNFLNGIEIAKALGLSDAEHRAIYAYTGSTYERLNGYLGGWINEKNLKTAPEVLEGFRDLLNQALAKLPKYIGTVRRDISLPDSVTNKYVAGKTVTYEQFTSTTMDETGAFGGRNVIYTIETKSGADISGLSKYRSEDEVLLPSGVEHKVLRKVFKDGKCHITLAEI